MVRKQRRLPLPGETLVDKGHKVKGDDIVARTALPGNVQTVNVAGLLGVPPEDVPSLMMKKAGEAVAKGEMMALSKGFFGLFKSEVKAPVDGTVENVSSITGQVILREPPEPVQVDAYIEGVVSEVIPREGVVVETEASFVQGIFGVGGEVRGIIRMIVDQPDMVVTAAQIPDDCKGQVLVGGSLVKYDAIERAVKLGAKAIVVGGIEDSTLRSFLGYDIGADSAKDVRPAEVACGQDGIGQRRDPDSGRRNPARGDCAG
jgi:hypothetical protein